MWLRPEHKNHVWAYAFVRDRSQDGYSFLMLTLIDVSKQERLTIEVQRRLRSDDFLHVVADAMLAHTANPSMAGRITGLS